MARSNSMGFVSDTPGQAKPVRIQHGHTAGTIRTYNHTATSDTASNTKNKGRPEVRVNID